MEFVYNIDLLNENATIIGIKDCPKVLEIPSKITHTDNKEYTVTRVSFVATTESDDTGLNCETLLLASTIKSILIYRNKSIKEIILPNTLNILMPRSFCQCEKLEKVVLPQGLSQIGGLAFSRCCSLKEIVIPDSVTQIGMYAFFHCISLYNVKLPSQLKKIGHSAFRECIKLSSISIPENVKHIDSFAFADCINLSNIILKDDIYFLPTTFAGCNAIKKLGDNYIVDNGILYNRDKTQMYTWLGREESIPAHIIAPSSVRKIENGFCRTSGIQSIDLSITHIEEIPDETFSNCSELKDVKLPEGLKKIGRSSFLDCAKLESVNLPNSIEEIGAESFSGCSIKGLQIPTNIAKIPDRAFSKCKLLYSITIPQNVKSISHSAFKDCPSISKVVISEGYEENIHKIFENSDKIDFNYVRSYKRTYTFSQRTGAYTNGRLSPCPYCGSSDIESFCDGTAECNSCGGEYTYWR